jgi:hypothetical protein
MLVPYNGIKNRAEHVFACRPNSHHNRQSPSKSHTEGTIKLNGKIVKRGKLLRILGKQVLVLLNYFKRFVDLLLCVLPMTNIK